ncbi:Interferon regulatory factor 2 [Desmophyllum pertusum]|uniref:Interferon regulatory factor 2 n=1 Tax=Desmophyllum pertusum TaxID=174260 RepID=A0A9X0D794_9CNID|nr:Interferon regulatory factor 2 [Desmophyllum pertusum]
MHDYSKLSGTKRMRFRDWLIQKLDSKEIEGVQWIDRPRGLFKIPWKHGSRHGWCVQTDVEIFRQWAMHSGKFRDGDKPDPVKWKTNFRCTLNALPDFKEVRGKSYPRGPKAYKIYIMRSGGKVKKMKSENGEKETEELDVTDREIVQMVDDMMTPGHIRPAQIVQGLVPKPPLVSRPRPVFSAFETLVVCKTNEVFPFPYTPWYLAAWNAMAVDQYVERPEKKTADVESADESASEETADTSE